MSVKPLKTNQQSRNTTSVVPVRSPQKPAAVQKTYHQQLDKLKKVHVLRKDNTLSCRYELKYRIPETKARAIAQYIRSYIAIDHYSRKRPDFQYPISSLYFDSNHLDLCRETIEQKTNRFKLRIRCYDDNPQSPCFVEIKRRLNTVIMKDRARVSKDMLQTIVRGNSVPGVQYKKDREVLRQFQFYLRTLRARPIAMIRYMRQAFEDDSQNRVRITFDRKLSYKTTDNLHITTNGTGWQDIPIDFVILEIKFTNFYPVWLNDVIKIFDIKQTAMSKYVSTVKQSCSMGYCGPLSQIGEL